MAFALSPAILAAKALAPATLERALQPATLSARALAPATL